MTGDSEFDGCERRNPMTQTKPILVTGATGKVGGEVLAQLRDLKTPVRALVRSPENARLPADVEIAQGDLSDPDTLDRALDDVDTAFLVFPTLQADERADAVIERIAKYARKIVYLSALGIPDRPKPQPDGVRDIADSHANIEELIRKSGADWTFLRPGGFASNTLMWAEQIRSGDVVRSIYADAARPLIHERDIGAVAVRALTETGHSGATYSLTGPEVLTQTEQVAIIGEVIGKRLRFQEISEEEAKRELFAGVPSAIADAIIGAHADMVRDPGHVLSGVQEITGRPAHTFAQWVADHVADFR